MELVKRWYNGYNYFGEKLYNPFDILLFVSKNYEFRNYWWGTGNPKFLIDKLKEENYYIPELENSIISEETLDAFDVDYIISFVHNDAGVSYTITYMHKYKAKTIGVVFGREMKEDFVNTLKENGIEAYFVRAFHNPMPMVVTLKKILLLVEYSNQHHEQAYPNFQQIFFFLKLHPIFP